MLTVKGAVLVLVMVQEPALRAAEQVPEEVKPVGMGLSVAVQLGSPLAPVTVKEAGEASEAGAEVGEAVPETQERETVTEAALLGTKSLLTVKVGATVSMTGVVSVIWLVSTPSVTC